MTTLLTEPQLVETAAANVAEIRSAIGAAKAAAAGPTTGVAAAAADEVSAATAQLFGTYAKDYHAVLARAAAFHEEFAAALASAGNTYAAAEAANASAISGAAPTLTSAVVQPPLQGTTIGLIMGGSGLPIPPPSYVSAVLNYVNHNFNVSLPNAQALFTPEGLYPIDGIKQLPFDAVGSPGPPDSRQLDQKHARHQPLGQRCRVGLLAERRHLLAGNVEPREPHAQPEPADRKSTRLHPAG